jgi:hypothetical protein
MRAWIEKIEQTPASGFGTVTLTVVVRRIDGSGKPMEKDFIPEWVKKPGNEAHLQEDMERYKEALSTWEGHEAVRVSHNNMMGQLHLGEIVIQQDTFIPQEPRK